MKRSLSIFILINSILITISTLAEDTQTQQKWAYRKIGDFAGYKAGIIINPGEVREYGYIKYDILNLSPQEKLDVKENMPNWRGEKYSVGVYNWMDTGFVFTYEFYSDIGVKIDLNEYDPKNKRNLKLENKYLKLKEIEPLTSRALVKAFAAGDINADGEPDFVIAYQDTVETKPREQDKDLNDYHRLIFEQDDSVKYTKKFQYDFSYGNLAIGKIEIKDVTMDDIPEVILWTLGYGGSGYGVGAEIFSRIKEK